MSDIVQAIASHITNELNIKTLVQDNNIFFPNKYMIRLELQNNLITIYYILATNQLEVIYYDISDPKSMQLITQEIQRLHSS